MALFPASFIDDLKSHANIVQIVQERVPLRRSGATWKGLCPFHGEKTPSFHVNDDKGFFHCFGCGVGGDVIKFVELFDKVSFPEAVRSLAGRVGLPVPEPTDVKQDADSQRERDSLLKAHEIAADWFRQQLAGPAGAAARRQLADREVSEALSERLGIGYAPTSRDGLKARLLKEGFDLGTLLRSGLVLQRDEGTVIDRFRNRIMIPIYRDNGAIVAFGGRAMDAGQQPKYLNSPETAIYVKGRTLYGLHWSKGAISKARYAVLVEGYFDVAQALGAGIENVVASSGTALTAAQGRLLKRFASKVVLSFDPDAAGQGAAARTSELLVSEGFQVNVAMLPAGQDPDNFIRQHGGGAYLQRLRESKPYLDYLLDRTAAELDLTRDEGRREFLNRMLVVAARIPEAAARDQFADRLAHRARITEEVVRSEIRKAAVNRQGGGDLMARQVISLGQVKQAERGLIWALMKDPKAGVGALAELEPEDLDGLATEPIIEQARSLQGWPLDSLPEALIERLNEGEAGLVREIGRQPHPPAQPDDCVRELRRLRYVRERTDLQREIDRLQEEGASRHADQIVALLDRKKALVQRIDALAEAKAGAP
ncbi:MAG: DNA primase [Vicinamibacterales bacterium]